MFQGEFNLDTCLIEFPGKQGNESWTIRDAVEGVQIFGGIGSGKTSGSGRMLALKYLAAGFGGLVLTVKPDEREVWQEYCRMTGREKDLIIVAPGGKNTFNFLEYESAAISEKKSSAVNIVQVLKTVIRASEEKSGGKSDDPFWETALDMLISNIIDLCLLAYGTVSVRQLYDIAQSVPRKDRIETGEQKTKNTFDKAFVAAVENVTKQIAVYESGLTHLEREQLYNNEYYDAELCNIIPDAQTLKFVDQFFTESFMNLSEKTRSIIDFSFSGFLFSLLREPIFSLFCRYPSTFTPDDCINGKIILIDLPVKFHHKVGRDSQILFKYVWQRAMEKRQVKENGRPVFLWADEAQHFLHEYDPEYQATARSSRIATVYISQNLPNYLANMGGSKSEFRVKSFLGTLGTKIFHANADIETNKYASELIGDGLFEDTSETATAAGQFSASQTKSIKIQRIVRPEDFVRLRTGGSQNNFRVDGYLHVQGSTLKNGFNHLKIQFNQNFTNH
ncbi:MAG: TraM recognition domain-containing protein [Verrucomicrobia bacterium]|nr:TraM recognition domain-containing protein [Verrucomicrobiota bacterium]